MQNKPVDENVKKLMWLQNAIQRADDTIKIAKRRKKMLESWKDSLHKGEPNEKLDRLYHGSSIGVQHGFVMIDAPQAEDFLLEAQ